MNLLLLFTATAAILFLLIINLLIKIHSLNKKLKYVDEANMWHMLAISDDLTGLYNRNAYNMQIVELTEEKAETPHGIILFDVDDFKSINDTKGHPAGDEVLKKVAKILLEVFPEPKFKVFRIGGDEFSVLSENISEKEIIRYLLELRKKLLCHNIGISSGYSIINRNFDRAIKYADEMLYADKLSKKYRNHLV